MWACVSVCADVLFVSWPEREKGNVLETHKPQFFSPWKGKHFRLAYMYLFAQSVFTCLAGLLLHKALALPLHVGNGYSRYTV